jgi:hypothetical protein
MAAIDDQITALEAILNAGVTTVSVDGQNVTYDLAAVRKRLSELRRERGTGTIKPIVAAINMEAAH